MKLNIVISLLGMTIAFSALAQQNAIMKSQALCERLTESINTSGLEIDSKRIYLTDVNCKQNEALEKSCSFSDLLTKQTHLLVGAQGADFYDALVENFNGSPTGTPTFGVDGTVILGDSFCPNN